VSRYRSYGKLDDPFTTEGDTFFLRMNARLRPNQLKPGEVALSKNGRMNKDGTWQTRKGLSTLFGSITSGLNAIRLPFIIASAQRQSGVVTLTLNSTPSLSFVPGDDITIADLGFTTDSPNGTFPLESVNFTTKQVTYISSSFVKHNGVFYKCLQDNTSSSSNEPGTVGGSSFWSSSTNASNASAWSASSVSYSGPGVDEPFTEQDESVPAGTSPNTSVVSAGTAIGTTLNFTLNDNGVNQVFGSAVFSDATSNNDDYIFTATDTTCIILRLKDSALFKCRYEAGGESVDGPVQMTQGLGKMFIFRTNQTTLEATPAVQRVGIASATQSGQTITVNTSTAHGRSVNDYITLTGLGAYTNDPNGCYQVVTESTNSFTVTMATSQTATFNVSGARVEYFLDFSKVANGDYTAPVYLTDTTAVAQDGVVTMDVTSHGLSAGDELTIQSGTAPFDTFANQKVRVTGAPTVNQFTFNLEVENVASSDSKTLTVNKPLAVGKGFIHQPAAPWGIVHERRLWLPYWYTSATTPTDRGIRDEIVASDIMDFDTIDVIGNQFRPSAGQSDYLVQLTPFTKDSLVVFNRKSIHLMTGISGSLADVSTNVVTTEIGCSARKSVVQVANQIMFLSDQGIYSVEFLDEYNLRGTGTPISETIQPFIDRINQDYVHLSSAVYFDNKYWIALPLDTVAGAGNASKLNTIIVYSFLNGGFESIDTVNSEEFAIRELIVGKEGAQNALYLTTEEGGVHKVDGFEGGDVVSMTAGQALAETIPIVSQVTTRQYDADSLDRKKFSRAEFHIKSGSETVTDGDITFISEDPDSTSTATSISTLIGSTLPADEDSSLRLRVNKQGFGIQADFKPSSGRPFLRAVRVDAQITDRSTTSIS
tara:strand:+ start:108 stop:2741 length:2634 start_codon:yes stop_codon:yes gene_type:complete